MEGVEVEIYGVDGGLGEVEIHGVDGVGRRWKVRTLQGLYVLEEDLEVLIRDGFFFIHVLEKPGLSHLIT